MSIGATEGRRKFPTPSPSQSGNWLQRTRQRGRRYCESAHSSPPKYCCVVPGDDALGTKGQEKAPNAQACPPRVNVCLQKLPVSDIQSPCSGRGEGRLQAECRKDPTFRVSAPPPHPRGSDCAAGGGVRRTTGHGPSHRGTEQNPAATQPPGPTRSQRAWLWGEGQEGTWGRPVSHAGDAGGGGRGGARHGTQGTRG